MLALGIPSLDEFLLRVPENDFLNFLALDYLQPWQPRRADYLASQVVQQLMLFQNSFVKKAPEIPPWYEVIPAPLDCTPEALRIKDEEKKSLVNKKLNLIFGHLLNKED